MTIVIYKNKVINNISVGYLFDITNSINVNCKLECINVLKFVLELMDLNMFIRGQTVQFGPQGSTTT